MACKGHIAIIATLVLGLAPWGLAQEKSKTAQVTLSTSGQVGSVVLPAGNYEVKHLTSASGHLMEFVRVTEWNAGFEGSPTYYERELVATVSCTMQPLTGRVGKTVIEKNGSRIVRLEINGENTAHAF